MVKHKVQESETKTKSSLSYLDNFLQGLFCISGIYFFFLIFGYYQESMPKLGSQNDRFRYNIFLISLLCFSNTICSFIAIIIKSRMNGLRFSQDLKNHVDTNFIKQVILISITYSVAMIATNLSLSHVNFPTQVLVKSGKMIPIVVGGFLFFGKKYPYYDYISVFLITGSLIMFNLLKTKNTKEVEQSAFGIFLLCISLLCDGLTGPRQDKLLTTYNIHSINLMFYINVFAFILNLSASLMLEKSAPYEFLGRYSNTYYYLLGFSLSGTFGQFFVFYSLKKYGSLYTSLFTTLRKALSTIVSVYLFGHVLKPLQWCCVVVIFTTLIAQNILKKMTPKHSQKLGVFFGYFSIYII